MQIRHFSGDEAKMKLISPYNNLGKWYKGSFHIHSTVSKCGWHSVDEIKLAYEDYDFMAITDHDSLTDPSISFKDKVMFRGIEVSSPISHMLLIEPPDEIMNSYSNRFTQENYQTLCNRCVEAGGLSVLNHPNRYHGQFWRMEDIAKMSNYTGIEIFSGDGIHVEEDIAFDKWDELLTSGKKVWGFGNDDFHHWGQEKRVWNVVRASEKSKEAILDSVRHGNFYVSTGFGFDSITVHENKIVVKLEKNRLFDQMYKYVTFFSRKGKVVYEKTGRLDTVEYTCKGDEGYVRIAAYADGGYGAFSQPVFIQP